MPPVIDALSVEAWEQLRWTSCISLPHLVGLAIWTGASGGMFPLLEYEGDYPNEIEAVHMEQIPSRLRGIDYRYRYSDPEYAFIRTPEIDSAQDLLVFRKGPDIHPSRVHVLSLWTGGPHSLTCTRGAVEAEDCGVIVSAMCGDFLLEAIHKPYGHISMLRNWKTGLIE
ncbi:hypothetical protein BV25DRAFT_766584 [Artomyces pyxidatus]|uniref:Uncharacterized protein n=1 Tax=Artomyces pyxidatus TaxID=48021 RepID=A0ACB8T0C5_9AGAM|nr:hypothetical protein BV25DRAFT_766584 [Artomyces pyxidatus]